MTLTNFQTAVHSKLMNRSALHGNSVPVLLGDDGNVVSDRDEALARKRLAVTVGSPRFDPTSRDSGTIVGKARLTVTVFEQPTRNRVGQARDSMTALEEAEAIACTVHLLPFDGGVVVFTGIGDMERVDDNTISRPVGFETIATLTGD